MRRDWMWLLGGGLLGMALRARPKAADQDERLRQWEQRLQQLAERLAQQEQALQQQQELMRQKQEMLAGLTPDQALKQLLQDVRQRHRPQLEAVEAEEWNRLASRHIAQAMQRVVAQTVGEHSLSTVSLPNDDYKGRIIGKEGRNLRLFESLTGVDLVIDDSPGCVSLSCFDPWRREVARLALTRLVQSGRFQPKKIEEAVAQAQEQMEKVLTEKGRQAAQNLNLKGLSGKLLEGLGRLAFRTSYRQNVLEHSQEVAWLCAHLGAELGADAEVCRRAGLLHDIGKGLTGQSGPHALTGAELCRQAGESEAVCHAVEAHHEDVPQRTLEATLVQVADAISAARPGARQDNTQDYLDRLELLENLGRQVEGVLDCQVVQAGREIRVFVRPEMVDDEKCMILAQQLADQIQASTTHPGPLRVTLIRQFQTSVQAG